MANAVSILPLTDDEKAALQTYSKEEEIYLQDLFKNATFLKMIARANLEKPDTGNGKLTDNEGAKMLAEIRGWEGFQKALFKCRKTFSEVRYIDDIPDDYTQD